MVKRFFAEFIGTLMLVLIGCGTAAITGVQGSIVDGAYLATAAAFGMAIVCIAYSVGKLSGGHVNPAVSIAMYIDGRISFANLLIYIVAQILGGIAGAGLLSLVLGTECGLGVNGLFHGSTYLSLCIEAVLTFIFVLTVLGVTLEENQNAGIVIGLALFGIHLLGISLTGTSVNPARSIGPALFVQGTSLITLWVFIVGPLIGGIAAGICWKLIKNHI